MQKEQLTYDYDLVIIGAGCVGVAMAYQARKHGKNCLLLEKQKIGSADRYWSSNFSARQNRVQYTEKYLTNYVILSNHHWDNIEKEAIEKDPNIKKFRHVEGALWFGDRYVTASQGNIFDANNVLQELNVSRLKMDNLIPTQPAFFKNFQFNYQAQGQNLPNNPKNWAALLQPDGGSIDMESSYNYFLKYATIGPNTQWGLSTKAVEVSDETTLIKYEKNSDNQMILTITKNGQSQRQISTEKIFIAAGIETSHITKNIFDELDVLAEQATIQQYVASYFQIEKNQQEEFNPRNFPNWIQFLEEQFNIGYGFPFHDWDTQNDLKTIKIGTMANNKYQAGQQPPLDLKVPNTDHRALAAIDYVTRYMNNLKKDPVANYKCPIVFYDGRETICDYLNRTQKDIVVQTGGWIGKYYPLLASSSYKLLFEFSSLQSSTSGSNQQIERDFLNRTSYPLRKRINNILLNQNLQEQTYDTIIVGAGVSGLYSAYRIMEQHPQHKLAIFDMNNRIAGRLWSIKFEGSTTPMELGGMRYIEQNHKLLTHYIKTLHIPTLDFQMSGNSLQNNSLHAYFRNDRYRQNEWEQLQEANQKLMTAYRIENNLIGMTAFQMISYSAYMIFTADYNQPARTVLNEFRKNPKYFDQRVLTEKSSQSRWINYVFKLDLQDWNILKPLLLFKPQYINQNNQGKSQVIHPLYKYGFQNIIENQFSHQAYTFISQQNGYFSNTSNASYVQQIATYLLDFGNVTYRTLAGGFDMFCFNLTNALYSNKKFQANGGGIYLLHELVNIQKNKTILNSIFGDCQYKLTFKQKSSCGTKCTQKIVYAKKVILGMPSRSIQILYNKIDTLQKPLNNYHVNKTISNLRTARLPKSLQDLLLTTQRMPAIKIVMNFTQNWWDISHSKKQSLQFLRSSQHMRGVSATDLPLRQCLYFGNSSDNFLLASYNDMVTTEFWKYLQINFDKFTPNQNKQTKNKKCKAQNDLDIVQASTQVVRQVIRQLQLIRGQKVDIAWVKEALYQNWGRDPFGAGYHNWFSGYDVQAVMKAVRRPWIDQDIFIVGEAFSNLTGWVQGALQTAEHVLIDQFNCKPTDECMYIGY